MLLVEDDGDAILVRQALRATGTTAKLHVVTNGTSALEFVRHKTLRPDLIILDLNLA